MPVEIHIVSTSDRTKESVGLPIEEDGEAAGDSDKKKKQQEILRFIRGTMGDVSDLPDANILPIVERAVKEGTSMQMAEALEIIRLEKEHRKDRETKRKGMKFHSRGRSAPRRVIETFVKDMSDLGKKVRGNYDRAVRRRRDVPEYEEEK
jgi:hypothetical protein